MLFLFSLSQFDRKFVSDFLPYYDMHQFNGKVRQIKLFYCIITEMFLYLVLYHYVVIFILTMYFIFPITYFQM